MKRRAKSQTYKDLAYGFGIISHDEYYDTRKNDQEYLLSKMDIAVIEKYLRKTKLKQLNDRT